MRQVPIVSGSPAGTMRHMTLALTPAHRRRRAMLAIPAIVVVVSALVSCGSESDSHSVTVEGAWARTSPMDSANGAAYFSITSNTDDALIGVSVDASVAARAELHESVMAGGGMESGTTMPMGEMTMRRVDSIELEAGTPVELKPGGYHVMLLDLAEPLSAGRTITLTLALESGDSVEVEVPVRDGAP
ncbi:MAG: hypothetical protein RLY45_779 [Actinomycetota bacterium]